MASEFEKLSNEVESIKRLLILMLVRSGATSVDISKALGVDSSTVRKMVPMRKSRQPGKD
jgi:Mn-dependent DtxR family transcriptional regulator